MYFLTLDRGGSRIFNYKEGGGTKDYLRACTSWARIPKSLTIGPSSQGFLCSLVVSEPYFQSHKIVLVKSQNFLLIFRKCRKSSENTIRSSFNCFEWHIVMQYCPVANYHCVHIITYGKVFRGTPNIFMFWLFSENGSISERIVNRTLICMYFIQLYKVLH